MKDLKSENLIVIRASNLEEIIAKTVSRLILINGQQRDTFVRSLMQTIVKDETVLLSNLQEVGDGFKNIGVVICERLGTETRLSSDPLLMSRVMSVVYSTVNDLRDQYERRVEASNLNKLRSSASFGDPTNVTSGAKNNDEKISMLVNNIENLTRIVNELNIALNDTTKRVDNIERSSVPSYHLKDGDSHISSHQEGC